VALVVADAKVDQTVRHRTRMREPFLKGAKASALGRTRSLYIPSVGTSAGL
jgi:hypothetical protein